MYLISFQIFTVKPENKLLLQALKMETVPLEDAYFGKKAFLTVSGQLHLEAMASHLGAVYSFNQVFRYQQKKSPQQTAASTIII